MMNIKLKEEALNDLLNDIEMNNFTADGCACGDYAYQLDEKLYMYFSRSCRKSSGTPDEKLWHIHNVRFYEEGEWEYEEYNGFKYRYQFHPSNEELVSYKLNKEQFDIIVEKLKDVSKELWGNEFRNEY